MFAHSLREICITDMYYKKVNTSVFTYITNKAQKVFIKIKLTACIFKDL